MDQKISFQEYLFYGFYLVLTIVKGMGFYEGMLLYEVGLGVAFLFLLGKLLAERYSLRQFVITAAFLTLGVVTWRISGKMGALFNLALLIGMREVNFKRLIRISAVVWSGIFSLQCFLTMSGLRSEQIFRIHRKLGTYLVRWSMGFTHPNVLHITYFVLLIFLMYAVKPRGRRLIFTSIAGMMGNILVFCYSVSYTGVVIVTLYLLINLILQSRRFRNGRLHVLCSCGVFLLPIACILFSAGAPVLLKGKVFNWMNRLLSTRLELSREYILGQGIHLFGNSNMETIDATITVDSSYVYMLVHYGLIYFILFAVLLELAVVYCWRRQDADAVAILLACAVSGVTEQYMANTSFKNVTILFIGMMLYQSAFWMRGAQNAKKRRDAIARTEADRATRTIGMTGTLLETFQSQKILQLLQNVPDKVRERFHAHKRGVVLGTAVLFCLGMISYLVMVRQPVAIYAAPWDCDRKEGAAGEAYVYDYDLLADPEFNGWILSDTDALGKLYDFDGITASSEYYRRATGRGIALVILFLWGEACVAVYSGMNEKKKQGNPVSSEGRGADHSTQQARTEYGDSHSSEIKRVLMLVNWKVHFCDEVPEGIQPPDYYIANQPYWFFRYMSPRWKVDVVDITAPKWAAGIERKIRFYIWQTLRILPGLGQYDLVISHGMQSGIVLALWRRLFGKGKYQHIVFDIGAFNSGRDSGKALKLMQFASKSLDGVIYHTQIQSEYYRKCHPWLVEKSQFIPFGTDAEYFVPENPNLDQGRFDAAGSDVGAAGSDKSGEEDSYILAFGKIKRDWVTLLRAYELSNKQLRLRIVGAEGVGSSDTRGDDISDGTNVEIYPPVSLSELQNMIREAAFCVVPLAEFPYSYGQMTLLQQMAMGKAVIAADVPSLQAYHDGDAVLWYQSGNARQLAEEINRLTENAEFRLNLERRARHVVTILYNEKRMAERIDDFLHERIG